MGLIPCALIAQESEPPLPVKLDLVQAESIALRYAPKIGGAYFQTEASKQRIIETRSALFPQITGIVSAVGTGNDISDTFGGNHVKGDNTILGATGGLNTSTVSSRESNGIVISQLITDFGRTSNLISAARYKSLSEQQKERLARAQVLFEVDHAYFKVLGGQALLRVAKETVSNRQLVVEQVGALTASQLKSELDLGFAKENLENAKLLLLQTQNAVDQAVVELSAAMGYKNVQKFELVEVPQYPFPDKNIETLVVEGLEFRPEVVALRAEWEGAKKMTAAERAARFPTINAIGSFGRTTIGNESVEGNYSAAGINVELPLFTGGLLSSRYKESILLAKSVQKEMQDVENQISKEVREAWLDSQFALKKIDETKMLLVTANEALDLASTRYKVGETSMIEFREAELNKTQAEIAFASAKYEYQINRVNLEFRTGALKFRTPEHLIK